MKPLVLLVLAGCAAWGQGQATLRARELFYTPPPAGAATQAAKSAPDKQAASQTAKSAARPGGAKSAPSAQAKTGQPQGTHLLQAAVPLGLRYAVLKRDASGRYQEVDPDSPFRAGDRIRLQINANTAGYLYVVMQGSSGSWQLLFPSAEVASGSNRVEKGQALQIPPGDRGQFVFDETAGTEKIFLVLTRQPEQDLDNLIYSMRAQPAPGGGETGRLVVAQATVRDEVVNRLRSEVKARDLVFEKVDSSAPDGGGRMENAAYVVNPSTSADARLVVDIALRHR
jgi:hypothetical protein